MMQCIFHDLTRSHACGWCQKTPSGEVDSSEGRQLQTSDEADHRADSLRQKALVGGMLGTLQRTHDVKERASDAVNRSLVRLGRSLGVEVRGRALAASSSCSSDPSSDARSLPASAKSAKKAPASVSFAESRTCAYVPCATTRPCDRRSTRSASGRMGEAG